MDRTGRRNSVRVRATNRSAVSRLESERPRASIDDVRSDAEEIVLRQGPWMWVRWMLQERQFQNPAGFHSETARSSSVINRRRRSRELVDPPNALTIAWALTPEFRASPQAKSHPFSFGPNVLEKQTIPIPTHRLRIFTIFPSRPEKYANSPGSHLSSHSTNVLCVCRYQMPKPGFIELRQPVRSDDPMDA